MQFHLHASAIIFNPALTGVSVERHWLRGGGAFPPIVSEAKRLSETGEAAFENSHRAAPNPCLTS